MFAPDCAFVCMYHGKVSSCSGNERERGSVLSPLGATPGFGEAQRAAQAQGVSWQCVSDRALQLSESED